MVSQHLLLIVTGGVAAYKTLDLCRRLLELNITCDVVLTKHAERFVTPFAFEAIGIQHVYRDLFKPDEDGAMRHISLARRADLIAVIPATANMMAKMTHGLADDLASTILLANDKSVAIAPAMNCEMWEHPAMQENVALLKKRGVTVWGPDSGELACGEVGRGRLLDVDELVKAVKTFFGPKPLRGRKALITAGPTIEKIDPVRYISNFSSGKQGYAIADMLAQSGADITLVTGPASLEVPSSVQTVIHVTSAEEMLAACRSQLPAEIIIGVAAVCDYRTQKVERHKIKKQSGDQLSLNLIENPDIVQALFSENKASQSLHIAFAAESSALIEHAQNKAKQKKADWIIANDIADGSVFGSDDNQVVLITQDHHETWPRASKQAIAEKLCAQIINYFGG